MAYRKAYLLNHDIDWYGRVSGRWIVASTMGGQLPSRADDERYLPLMQVICSNLPYLVSSEEITVNEDLIQERYDRAVRVYREYYINNEDILRNFLERYTLPIFRSQYIESFVDMARRGFDAYIRVNIDDPTDNTYKLVARPTDDASVQLSESLATPLPIWLANENYRTYLTSLHRDTDPSQPLSNVWDIFNK